MTTDHHKPPVGKILTVDNSSHQFRIMLVRPPNTIKTHEKIKAIRLEEIKFQTSSFHQWDSLQLTKEAHRLTQIHVHNNTHHKDLQTSFTHRVNNKWVDLQMHIHHLSKDNSMIHVLTNSSNSNRWRTTTRTALTMRLMMSMKAW